MWFQAVLLHSGPCKVAGKAKEECHDAGVDANSCGAGAEQNTQSAHSCPVRVTPGKTRTEHNESALPRSSRRSEDRCLVQLRAICRHAEDHPIPPANACRRRGSRTVNSVKSPTSLSTVRVPPCCWATIS